MSLLVVILVGLGVFFYVRSVRAARQAWLTKLSLVGSWHWEQGDGELVLNGSADRGSFVQRKEGKKHQGEWLLQGHELILRYADEQESYDLIYFKPGNIGLEGADGERMIYVKETSNVVHMQRTEH